MSCRIQNFIPFKEGNSHEVMTATSEENLAAMNLAHGKEEEENTTPPITKKKALVIASPLENKKEECLKTIQQITKETLVGTAVYSAAISQTFLPQEISVLPKESREYISAVFFGYLFMQTGRLAYQTGRYSFLTLSSLPSEK